MTFPPAACGRCGQLCATPPRPRSHILSRVTCEHVTLKKSIERDSGATLGHPAGIQGVFIVLLCVHKRIKEGITALWSVWTQCVLRATERPRGLVWSAQQRPVCCLMKGLLKNSRVVQRTGEKNNGITLL